MKKITHLLTILLIFALALCVAACGDKNPQNSSADKFTVSYYDGDTVLETRTVEEGEHIPDIPADKQGNRFAGWFLKDGSAIDGVTVQSDIAVYARWIKLYTVVLDYGRDIPSERIEAAAGESIDLPEMRSESAKAMILRWTDGANYYEAGDVFIVPALDVTLTAEWADILTITYVYNGEEHAVEAAKGSGITMPDGLVSDGGSHLYSWTDGDEVYLAGETITAERDMRLTAMWEGDYTLTYDVGEGEPIQPHSGHTGDRISLPSAEWTGHTLLGWQIRNKLYPSGSEYVLGAENVTATAVWEYITFDVSFADWDGYPFAVVQVNYGEDVVFPDTPITSLAEFAGWSSDGKNITADTVITAIYNYDTPAAAMYSFAPVGGGYSLSLGDASLLNGKELVLPASYRGLPVVAVSDSPYPSSTLGGLKGVEKVTLSSSYQALGRGAFRSMDSLTSVILNDGLSSIGYGCFYNCERLTDLKLNEGLKTIGSRAFYNVGISDFYIPASVETIGELAFFYYPSTDADPATCFKSITVDPKNSTFASDDGVLYTKDMSTLICYPANREGESFTLPASVTALGTYCFSHVTNIKNFSFGDSRVNSIGRLAFNCATFDIELPSSMTEITEGMLDSAYGNLTLSDTIKVIPSRAFFSFYGETVYIPANVESLEEYAFYHCPGVKNLYFAEGCKVQTIPAYAFEDCPKLANVSLHEGVKEIGAYAFSVERIGVNANQITDMVIPASVERIGEYAFSFCSSLISVSFAEGSVISEISTGAFGSCYKLKTVAFGNNDKSVELVFGDRAFALADDIANFEFPANLVSIGAECFAGSESQTYGYHSCKITEVVLPASVRTIGDGAFSVAKSLEHFSAADGSALETMGSSVFYNCVKLSSVVLPESLRHMGAGVFFGCTALEDVKVLSTSMNYQFENGGLYNTDISSLDFAKVGEDGVFTIREGTLSVADSCFTKSSELRVINIASTVREIGKRAFYDCPNLEEVNIPKDSRLETIGEYAFASSPLENTPSIPFKEIYLPETLKSIGSSAFYNTAISSPLHFSAELTELGGYAFAYCDDIPSVTFAENSKLKSIGAMAFYKCSSLASVVFGEGSSLESLATSVFNGCPKLTTVVLTSQNVVEAGRNVFANSAANLSIFVPDGLLTSYINDTGWGNYVSCLKPMNQYNPANN